jgi:hypothetical protein
MSRDAEVLLLAQELESPLNIPVMDVDSLWVRGNHWKTGAIVGSVLGAAFGVAAGLSLSEYGCECGHPSAGAGMAGGAIFGAGGALLGAGIGALIPKWHRRLP